MSKQDTWKNLERCVAAHFGVNRNIRRGQDYRITDTDVDVFGQFNPDGSYKWGANLIVECKYRIDGTIPKLFKPWANDRPSTFLRPLMFLWVAGRVYAARKLGDFD